MSYRWVLPLLVFLASPALADETMAPGTPACGQALAAADQTYDQSEAALDATGAWETEAYCAALSHHADTIEATVKIYDQCLPDDDGHKTEGLAMMSKQAGEFRDLMIGEGCPGT